MYVKTVVFQPDDVIEALKEYSLNKGIEFKSPEKPLTKRDRQRLKKKMKKNKSY